MITKFNYYRQVESPTMYLCNPDGRFLCALEASERKLSLRFNDLSEITFTVNSAHINKVAYGLVERRRLIYIEDIGWFQIADVQEETQGDVSTKSVSAYSHQIQLQESGFVTEDRVYTFVNTNDLEDDQYDYSDPAAMPSVIGQLCKQAGLKLGSMAVSPISEPTITEDLKQWTIVWITPSVRFNSLGIKDDETGYNGLYTPANNSEDSNPCRSFSESSDQNAYDFIINEVEKAFNVVFEFDFLHHAIFVRDYEDVNIPTDIYLSFDNVATKMAINEKADELVTVMEVSGDGLDITNVNPMGTNYVADFEYYMKDKSEDGKVDYPWMSKELVGALQDWEEHLKAAQEATDDGSYTQLMQELYDQEKLKTENDEELVYANLKVNDLEVVVKQMQIDKENASDEALTDEDGNIPTGQEYITAEEVDVDKNSLYPPSVYFKTVDGQNTVFEADNPDKQITAYKSAPKMKEIVEGDKDYVFYYDTTEEGSDQGTTGTPNELIKEFISTKEDLTPLYFFDGKVSFCRLITDDSTYLIKNESGALSTSGTVRIINPKEIIKIVVDNGEITEATHKSNNGTIVEKQLSIEVDDSIQSPNTIYYIINDKRYGVETSEAQKSFCKLVIDTEVQAVKDADGKLSETGMVTFDNQNYNGEEGSITFAVTSGKITEGKFIPSDGGDEISLPIGDGETSSWDVNTTYYSVADKRYGVLKGANSTSVRYFYVSGFVRYTMYSQVPGDSGWKTIWENEQKRLTDVKEQIQDAIDGINESLSKIAQGYDLPDGEEIDENAPYKNYGCNVEYFIQRYDKDHGTELYLELKHYWIEGEYSNENYAETEDMPFEDRLTLSRELMLAAQEDLSRAAKPKYETTVNAINFLKIKEFETFSEQLELGRLITIEKSDGNFFQPALMEISYNLDTAEDFSMSFSTATRPNSISLSLADILKETSSVSKTVVSNWSDLTDYSKNKETITNLIEKPLDSTLRAAIGNMANQQFTIDETGILGRKIEKAESGEDGETAEKFSPRQVRLINNVLLFTEDNWLTSSLALGEVSLDDNTTAYGLIADVLVGNLIMGSNLKISNESNTITLDESGITIKVPGEDGDGETVFSADNSGNVMLKGKIYATDGTIGGLKLTKSGIYSVGADESENGNFKVTSEGIMTLKGANISGEITATGGKIGGFTIGDTALYNGTVSMTSTEAGVYLGTDGLNLGGKFKAAKDGTVTITAGSINLGNGNFEVTSKGKVTIKDGEIVLTRDFEDGHTTSTFNEEHLNIEFASGSDRWSATIENGHIFLGYWNSPMSPAQSTLNLSASATGVIIRGVPYLKICGEENTTLEELVIDGKGSQTSLSGTNLVLTAFVEGHINGGTWYRNGTTIDFSDKKIKNSIEEVDERYSLLFDRLKPVRYKYNLGTSDRYHTGLIAQDVKNAIAQAGLSTKDFAAYAEWETDEPDKATCGIRYGELISLCIAEIQKLKKQLKAITPK